MEQQPQRLTWPELETLRDLQGHPALIEQFYEGCVNEIIRIQEGLYNNPDIGMALRGEYVARYRLIMELLNKQTEYVRTLLQEAQPEEQHS